MTTRTTLKPCPFRGSTEVSIGTGKFRDGTDGRYVECEKCAAATEMVRVGLNNIDLVESNKMAAEVWNLSPT
jgi:formate dehydrogenase maturation protein FdhE